MGAYRNHLSCRRCRCLRWSVATGPEVLSKLAIAMHVVKPHIQVRVGLHNLAIEKRLEIFCQDRSTATSDDHGIDIPIIYPETINFIGNRRRQLTENLICQTFKI